MNVDMEPAIYEFLQQASAYLVAWSCLFSWITAARIVLRIRREIAQVPDNALLTELAGLPLTFLLSVSFVRALRSADWMSMLLFLWWGPGFVATLVALLMARLRRQRINWRPLRYIISYLCKINYLAMMFVFLRFNSPGMVFAFSVWIINDQIEKAFMSLDADRTRRTFDDLWIPRICYPAGLLIPWFYADMPFHFFEIAYGSGLLILWGAGLCYIYRHGKFFALPNDPTLLRNMVYFPKLRVQSTSSQESLVPVSR